MVQAKGQAERYAKALPTDHGCPPFLLVADIGYCIEVYADFSGMGKSYAQFPDRSRYRIMLDDLRNLEVRERLAAIWEAPASLDPAARAARITRHIADLLVTVARWLEKRGHTAERTSGFLMRLLFTMFAENMHAKRRSREKATDYLIATTGIARGRSQGEIDRYTVWSGQACSSKIGRTVWVRLRDEARRKAGASWDLEPFHRVLTMGAMPLTILEAVARKQTNSRSQA